MSLRVVMSFTVYKKYHSDRQHAECDVALEQSMEVTARHCVGADGETHGVQWFENLSGLIVVEWQCGEESTM